MAKSGGRRFYGSPLRLCSLAFSAAFLISPSVDLPSAIFFLATLELPDKKDAACPVDCYLPKAVKNKGGPAGSKDKHPF